MKLNKNLLPIKLHFFLFNAGMGCLVPYLSTIVRQLGFTTGAFGGIYAALSISGLLTKLLLNGLLKKYKSQKLIFILFQIVTTVSLGMIYFVPRLGSAAIINLDCYGGLFYLKSCYYSGWMVDQCKVNAVSESENMAECHKTIIQASAGTGIAGLALSGLVFDSAIYLKIVQQSLTYFTASALNCIMSPHAWHAVCESWHLEEYCHTKVEILDYTTHLGQVMLMDQCAYISAISVTLDGHIFTPHCDVGGDLTCRLNCDDENLSGVIGNQSVIMTCLGNIYNYRICGSDTTLSLLPTKINSGCKVTCTLDPWRLLQICEEWRSYGTETCRARKIKQDRLPTNLSLTVYTQPIFTTSLDVCVYTEFSKITMPDASEHQSSCSKEMPFQIPCETKCDDEMLNDIFQAASDSNTITTHTTKQLFYLFILMICSWVGQIVVVTIADAVYFDVLGQEMRRYGKQRLWGSIARGTSSLLTGILIDAFSDSEYKDYTIAFVLMLGFMTGDIIVSCFLNNETTKTSNSILTDVDARIFSTPYVIVIVWAVEVGICSGIWQFLFWYLEDIANLKDLSQCRSNVWAYIKTLQGLVSAIQTFCGELPFMFGCINRLGKLNVMSVALVAFGGRFILYSLLKSNPWWVLPIELLYSGTSNIFHYTMASFSKKVSTTGTETTVLGSIGVVSEAVGASLGSLIGGYMFEKCWAFNYLLFGIGSLVFYVLQIVLQSLIKDNSHTPGNKKTETDSR